MTPVVGPFRRWWKRRFSLPGNADRADRLIWRSTGLFGGFRADVCWTLMLYPEFWDLTDDEFRKILKRYREHVSRWNIPMDTIGRELCMLTWAAHKEAAGASRMFDDAGLSLREWGRRR